MAATTAKIEYLRAATYGSAAYDLDRVPGYEEYVQPRRRTADEEARRAKENAADRQRAKERAAAKAKAKAESYTRPIRISMFSVAGFAVVAALIVCVLLSYVQLAEISGNMTALQSEMNQLNKEEKRLTVEYEKAFNLAAIEKYATQELNMTRITDDQIIMVDIERGDTAEILTQPETKGVDTVTGAVDYITSLMAYFK